MQLLLELRLALLQIGMARSLVPECTVRLKNEISAIRRRFHLNSRGSRPFSQYRASPGPCIGKRHPGPERATGITLLLSFLHCGS